jgi:sugar/nucleoside kinase (ribokinase family)
MAKRTEGQANMILVFGDLIVDLSLHIPDFPIQAGDIQRATYLEIGPGGATNVAITATRLGMDVGCMGEIGSDRFGRAVLAGLRNEQIDVGNVRITPEAETPVAGVVVDQIGEPAYLGYGGSLQLKEFPEEWKRAIRQAEALFTGGWAEYEWTPKLILAAMRVARKANVPVFFDPGPGNPAVESSWWQNAIGLTTVFLATETEARNLTGHDDPLVSAHELLKRGPEMVVIKRGAAGCFILNDGQEHIAPGFPVQARDATGAGDSLNAAVMCSFLKKFDLEQTGRLANATGAAKVQKTGTGHSMPTAGEIREVLTRFGMEWQDILPPNPEAE